MEPALHGVPAVTMMEVYVVDVENPAIGKFLDFNVAWNDRYRNAEERTLGRGHYLWLARM